LSRTRRENPYEYHTEYYQIFGDLDEYGNPNHRDIKPWGKPPGWFKRIRRRIRRHKTKMAMRNHKEIPVEKHNDQWDWN